LNASFNKVEEFNNLQDLGSLQQPCARVALKLERGTSQKQNGTLIAKCHCSQLLTQHHILQPKTRMMNHKCVKQTLMLGEMAMLNPQHGHAL
jgi:hypothetical protein